jgi:hypothetical protein
MSKRNLVLVAAVVGLAAFLCMVVDFTVAMNFNNAGPFMDEAAHRESVERSLDAVLPAEVESADSPDLADAADRLSAEKYIVWVWVTDPEGVILLSHNGPAEAGDDVQTLSQYEEDLILAVEPQRLDPVTELELRLAMALRREGEHNDIYGHLVRSVPGPDGRPAAFVGVTYELTDSTPGALDIVFLVLGAAGILTYWLGLPLWVFLDERAAGGARNAALWGLFVLIANAGGLLAYLLVKHRGR